MVFARYSGFLHYLQLASHEFATIGINVTKNEIQIPSLATRSYKVVAISLDQIDVEEIALIYVHYFDTLFILYNMCNRTFCIHIPSAASFAKEVIQGKSCPKK